MTREEIQDELYNLRALAASRQRLFRRQTRDPALKERMRSLQIALKRTK